ncbi:MAG TPA: DNA polymerase I, partial [Thermoanaerobaculia bacterium]|nr:DNA polymerase I [Thermoanaerobaculia bacterium]
MSAAPAPVAGRPRLYLIDGYSNIFRAFYAIRGLSTSKGESTNAVYGFVTMLRKLLREHRPELVGVALDVGGPTVRSARYEEYKANRTPMPDDLRAQIPRVREILAAYRIPILQIPEYEADDVLGTLACRAAEAGYEVVLVSADKDLMQLVGEHVSLLHTGREKLYDRAGVEEDFGVPPEKVVDVLALAGDSIDNVPGVPGIGEKGARGLIREYGSLDELLARAGEVSRKAYREGLEQHAEQALLSRELATIHCDLPIAFEPDALRLEPPDTAELKRLFGEMEFHSLVEELAGEGEPAESPPAREAATAEEWRAAVGALPGAGGEVVLAVLGEERPLGLAVATGPGGGEGGEAAEADAAAIYADFRRSGLGDAALATIAAWACRGEVRLVGHDLKEVLRAAFAGLPGGACPARLTDLMLVSYLLKPTIHGHSLDELALERLRRKTLTAKDVGWERGQEPPVGDERLALYAGERIDLVRRLAPELVGELGGEGDGGDLARIYREIEEPLLPVLLRMEEAGILLDTAFLAEMSTRLERDLARLETEIFAAAGETFNIGSPQQLGQILFEKLGYPVLKRTRKTKSYATGAEILEELAARGYPLPDLVLRQRELSKLKSTYVDALPALVGADGRLHTRFNQAVAATGRLSSANPNLQNIPIRTELGQQIRRAFVAAPGALLLVADYSQIELRILAHIAGEEALVESFRRGEDVHRTTAAAVLGVAPELVNPEQRRAAKTINFGIIYGMSAYGLSQTLHIPPKEAERFIAAYMERYPGVRRYVDETLAAAERDGGVSTLWGRVRWLPDITSKNWNLRENARRMAINARIQGTAADFMKKAMIEVDRRLRQEAPEARLLLTVHDELVLEVPEGEVERVAAAVREEMAGVAEMAVPLVVDTG